jgi:hypothetical protein
VEDNRIKFEYETKYDYHDNKTKFEYEDNNIKYEYKKPHSYEDLSD